MAFECGICTSMYNTGHRIPLLLECGHTFCQSCVLHNLGAQRCCPYCRHPIQKRVDDLPRNYALENAMEATNLPLVELMDRWGLSNAERMMVKPDHLTLDSLMSRKGYTGEVWQGSLWGKPVAVKLLPLLDVDERQLECLRREVAVLLHTTGECKQVCIYKGFCVKESNFAIIMKLYSYSLANRISRAPGRRLPLPLALKYSIDIIKGLVELHRLGVIAADLKPDNVLIDEELGDAVIADFGISSVVTTTIGNTGRGSAVRSSGTMRGTPNYMAPEQFAPGCRTTNKVDIWGFAATLLHMVTGTPPWHQDTLMQICTAVGVAKQAPALPEGLPPPLQALMVTCFDAEPARRPTAVQLLKALQALGPIVAQHMAAAAAAAAAATAPSSRGSSNGQSLPQQQVLCPTAVCGAGKGAATAVDDKQAGVDQYLAQLGLASPYSRQDAVSSGGGGAPSAPPLPSSGSGGAGVPPGSSSYISSTTITAAAGMGRRSSSNGGGSSSGRHKLPRVIWTEEEALTEQQGGQQLLHQQQQQHRQHNTATVGVGSSEQLQQHQHQQQQKQHWGPHHVRSASEHVSGLSSRAYQQQQLQQQLVQPHEVAGAANWAAQQQQQQQHGRSRSELVPGWDGAAVASQKASADAAAESVAAAPLGSSSSSCGVKGVAAENSSLLTTHYESSAAGAPQQQLLTAELSGGHMQVGATAAGAGVPVKRQRQQWNTPAAAQASQQQQQAAPAGAAAADDAAGYSKWPNATASAVAPGGEATDLMAPHSSKHTWEYHQEQHHSQQQQQQQHTQWQQPVWWETPFDVSSTCRTNSNTEAVAAAAAAAASASFNGSCLSPLPTTPLVTGAAAGGAESKLQICPQDVRPTSGTSSTTTGNINTKQGAVPPPLLVHAHAEGFGAVDAAAGLDDDDGGGGGTHQQQQQQHNGARSNASSSNGSLSRAASCDSFTASGYKRGGDGVAPSYPSSVCSRPGSAKRQGRTITNLLLGRAASRAALPCELAVTEQQQQHSANSLVSGGSAADAAAFAVTDAAAAAAAVGSGGVLEGAAGSGSSSSGIMPRAYSPSLTKIRMAFGPASPERVPRGGGSFGSNGSFGSSGSALMAASAATAAVATPCTGATAAAAAAGGAALCSAGTTAAAAAAAGTAACTASAGTAAGAAGATAAVSTGVVAAMASRFGKRSSKGSKNSSSAGSVTCSPSASASGGSPASHTATAPPAGDDERLQQDVASSSPAAAAAAVAAVVPGSPAGSGYSISTSSCNGGGGGASGDKPSRWRALFGSPSRRRPPTPQGTLSIVIGSARHGSSVLDATGVTAGVHSSHSCPERALQQQQPSASHVGGVDNSTAGCVLSKQASTQAIEGGGSVSGGGACDKQQQQQPPLTLAAAAEAEAARASGTCSPLKMHARNLSLPAKLMLVGSSAESSPASSPNPVASAISPMTAAAAAASGPASPSKLGAGAGRSSSSGGGGGGVDTSSSSSGPNSNSLASSGGSHSQVLAEAVHLEVLARNLSQGGRHEEAEAALRNGLGLLSKQLGPGHPNTVAATTRLALHLNRNRKHVEAEQLLRQVLSHKQAMLGRKHPQVAAASINLAACLYSQGHYHAAARLYAAALEIRRCALGDAHADTAACLNNLALCHSRLSDWSQAEQLFREALSARVAALGQLHPDVAITAHQLGHCLGQLGQHTEALVYHKQGLWVRQQQERRMDGGGGQQQEQLQQDGAAGTSSHGDGSGSSGSGGGGRSSASGGSGSINAVEDLVSSHRCVALCLARLGCDSQAQEHLAHVVQVRGGQVAALKPPPAPGSSSALSGSLGGRGLTHSRNASSISAVDWEVLADGDSRLSQAEADGLLALAGAAEELGRCLSRQGKHSEAEEQYWQALETRSQVLGSRHELVMATEEQLRNCLEQQC